MTLNLSRSLRLIAVLLLLMNLAVPAAAQGLPKEDVIDMPAIGQGLCVSNLFQSNMVLQRDKPIHLWGWAEPGEKVSVSFAGNSASATAGKDRKWKVTLPAVGANAEPQTLDVRGGKDQLIRLDNILVGDVWVLGGQSNMEHPLSRVENGNLEIVSANYPQIRVMTVPVAAGPEQTIAFPRLMEWSGWFGTHFRKGYWDVCSPEVVEELSAIGYVFARRIHTASQVPIGVIDVSRGGTTVETWTPADRIRKIDGNSAKALMAKWDADIAAWDAQADLAARVEQHKKYIENMTKQGNAIPADRKDPPTDLRPGPVGNHNMPSACYNGMIAPLAGLSVKGAIFHQGYNNCFDGTEGARMYREVFPEMVKAWRDAFGDPNMAFGILSLCTEGNVQTRDNYTEMMYNAGPYIREAQYQTFLDFYKAGDKNIGYISTYDLRRRWYHPQLKAPAGERAARWALASQYGMERQVQWKPAMIQEMKAEDGKVILKFDTAIAAVDDGSAIEGFAIAGSDRKFHPAEAQYLETGKDDRGRPQFDRKTLVLTSIMVPEPVAYRYAWGRSPMGNLQVGNTSDIPLATQRSDDWAMEEIPLGVLGEGVTDASRADRGKIINALKLEDIRRKYVEAQQFIEANKDKVETTGTN